MRTFLITAVLLSAAALPGVALAQETCGQGGGNRVVGTVAGAGIGGVLGNIIAGGGDKTLGTIIGAVGGGVVGNQVTKGNSNCERAYGYYDQSGAWRASDVPANAQTGYYDRDGKWIDGAPRGYYDKQNRWVAANGTTQAGYRDNNGRWVAPSANDFNNRGDRVGTVNGYWQNGRWIPGETIGSYDRNGRWVSGAAQGHRDARGNWVADAQPGYYDRSGRWRAGTTSGAYDPRGVWVASNDGYVNSGNENYGSDGNGRRDVESRFARIEQRIDRGVEQGNLSRSQAERAGNELDAIRRYDQSLRTRNGTLSARNEALVQARLDKLNVGLRGMRGNG